jgi:hypothetical protein
MARRVGYEKLRSATDGTGSPPGRREFAARSSDTPGVTSGGSGDYWPAARAAGEGPEGVEHSRRTAVEKLALLRTGCSHPNGLMRRPRVSRVRGERLLLWAVLAVLVAVTLGARVPRAHDYALWADEVYSARTIIAPSAGEAVHRIRLESSPPAWFFLGRLTHQLGASAESFRFWSVASSVLLTVLVVLYSRRFLPLHGAALAGLLTALGNQLVFHGTELRAYALLALLALVLPLVLEAAAAKPSRARLAALGLVVAVGSMTHYFFLLPLFVGLLWLWTLRGGAPSARLRVTLAAGLGTVPLLLWLPVVFEQAERVNSWFGRLRRERVLDLYSQIFASPSVWEVAGDATRLGVLGLVLAGAIVLARRADARLAALMAVVPVAATAVVSLLGLHVFTTRNLIVVAPYAAIAVAALASLIPMRPLAYVASAAVAAAVVWTASTDLRHGRTPYDEIGATLADFGWTGREPLLFFGRVTNHRGPLGWHLPGHPQLGKAEPASSRCDRVYAIIQRPSARRWLKENDDEVIAQRSFPWFRVDGERNDTDILVARLDWSDQLLTSVQRKGPDRAVIFYSRTHGPPPCVEALPLEPEPRSLF